MNRPFHILRLYAAPAQRDSESIQVVTRTDVHWGGLIFKAPASPTPHQLCSDLPFFVNFPSKERPLRWIA